MTTPKNVLLKWIDALNSHDANMAANLYHDDAVNLQVAIGKPLEGKKAILNDFYEFFKVTPDTTTKVENLFEDGEWAILEWSGAGTFYLNGERTKAGKKYTLQGCGFFKIIDGKISIQRGYWDKATWFKQVGLPIE